MIRRGKIFQCVVAILLSTLASDVWAQPQALVGEWRNVQDTDETDLDSRLTLAAAGAAHVELAGIFSQGFLAGSADEDVQQLADLFPEGLQIQIIADGTWVATDDSLTLSFPDPDLLINGGTFEAFLITIATSLAQAVIEQLNLPADQEPTVIATFVELLAEDLSEQDVTDQAFASGGEATAYRLEQGVLILVDADGSEARWHNLTASLVAPTGWGDVKRHFQRQ
ncbi:MAG: hypothetical protein HOM68_28155 [Gemmatimonadetes bacterium]|jgi:hypothetical protein|nr:hypothetical protein [Gemmatimonadota bacterium]MBT5060450.1 hypothetical protein [Gemmatimonadota bacterium]MBT5142404.1 hypothetical protein [Gemmatimonadota bacterium]MBT5588218.1 hypothetical protein [Gemmatimonadota bacterium]MBT5961069.1 hypothetical protein [Gemmatimonadota bacterium]